MRIIPINTTEEVTYRFHIAFTQRKRCCQDKDHEAYSKLRETNMPVHLTQLMINNKYIFFLSHTFRLFKDEHIHLN